ncbi:Zn -Cys binuclear cluster domain-containing protein [Lentinula edodes]|uniref:Zn-Cys binuclear cluster domain-containing protein n=1 Tax=Lentinula edodes TaxID=5353 RepID=A0A1Q3DZW6_LENED|nr:Zn -Cys binuclear cluster domain-containing protein [Lentinula edodes]
MMGRMMEGTRIYHIIYCIDLAVSKGSSRNDVPRRTSVYAISRILTNGWIYLPAQAAALIHDGISLHSSVKNEDHLRLVFESISDMDASTSTTPIKAKTPRNQNRAKACSHCRKRKTKCDGKRPICTQCHARSKPGFELVCEYPMVGQTRKRTLEESISTLERRIRELERAESDEDVVRLYDPSNYPSTRSSPFGTSSNSPSSSSSLLLDASPEPSLFTTAFQEEIPIALGQQLLQAFIPHAKSFGFFLNLRRFISETTLPLTLGDYSRPCPGLICAAYLIGLHLSGATEDEESAFLSRALLHTMKRQNRIPANYVGASTVRKFLAQTPLQPLRLYGPSNMALFSQASVLLERAAGLGSSYTNELHSDEHIRYMKTFTSFDALIDSFTSSLPSFSQTYISSPDFVTVWATHLICRAATIKLHNVFTASNAFSRKKVLECAERCVMLGRGMDLTSVEVNPIFGLLWMITGEAIINEISRLDDLNRQTMSLPNWVLEEATILGRVEMVALLEELFLTMELFGNRSGSKIIAYQVNSLREHYRSNCI